MKPENVSFLPGSRYTVVVTDCADQAQAEKDADLFLREISAMDDSGASYQRVRSHAEEKDGQYIFEVFIG